MLFLFLFFFSFSFPFLFLFSRELKICFFLGLNFVMISLHTSKTKNSIFRPVSEGTPWRTFFFFFLLFFFFFFLKKKSRSSSLCIWV